MAEKVSVKNKRRRQKHKPATFDFSNNKPEMLTIQIIIFFIMNHNSSHKLFFSINHLKNEQIVNDIPMTCSLCVFSVLMLMLLSWDEPADAVCS